MYPPSGYFLSSYETITVEVPRNVGRRLSNNSSTKEVLDKIKPEYEDSLRSSGFHEAKINFQPKQTNIKTQKNKKKKVLCCNLPWNMALKTNIGKEFLALIDKFKNTPQGKYINRHTGFF